MAPPLTVLLAALLAVPRPLPPGAPHLSLSPRDPASAADPGALRIVLAPSPPREATLARVAQTGPSDLSLPPHTTRLALAPPRSRRPAPAPTPAPAPPPAPAYSAEQAGADLTQVLSGRGREYLEARARLEANPAQAAPAIVARLGAVPAPTAVEQRRLLAVLGVVARPEDVHLFAAALRREVAAAVKLSQEQGTELRAAEPWREILRAQGPVAAAALTELIAVKEFTEDLRAQLLGDLVAVTATDALSGLIDLVGLGAPTLRAALRQAIARRALATPAERPAIVASVDAALASGDPARKAGLILLRAVLGDPAGDPAFTRLAAAIAEDDAGDFGPRVAALRVLIARRDDPVAQTSLANLAARHLAAERRAELRSEILGGLALGGLNAAAAAALVDRLALTRADAPRLAVPAYAVATLGPGWLDESQRHPWPEVRAAALARVAAPCDAPLMQRLRDALALGAARSERDPAVAREAIAAVARCGGTDAFAALSAIVGDPAQGVERRFDAGRFLVDDHRGPGADVVAAALRAEDDPIAALRLIRALARLQDPASPAVRDALCRAAGVDQLAAIARRTARELFPDDDEPCPRG